MKRKTACDASLLTRIADGDRHAFDLFYREYFSVLSRYAAYYSDDYDLRKDIVSDVFLNLWQSKRTLPRIRNINNFLLVCVRNQALKYGSRTGRLSVSINTIHNLHDRTSEDALRILEKEEARRAVADAINTLPERCRLIYLMVKEEKMKYKDVAEVLNISEKTIQAQMIIALKKIGYVIMSKYRENEI